VVSELSRRGMVALPTTRNTGCVRYRRRNALKVTSTRTFKLRPPQSACPSSRCRQLKRFAPALETYTYWSVGLTIPSNLKISDIWSGGEAASSRGNCVAKDQYSERHSKGPVPAIDVNSDDPRLQRLAKKRGNVVPLGGVALNTAAHTDARGVGFPFSRSLPRAVAANVRLQCRPSRFP